MVDRGLAWGLHPGGRPHGGGAAYNLSRKLSRAGMPSFRPLRLRVSATTWQGRVPFSKGSPGRICQWSNTHCGKAWPPVLDLRSAVKPVGMGRDTYHTPSPDKTGWARRSTPRPAPSRAPPRLGTTECSCSAGLNHKVSPRHTSTSASQIQRLKGPQMWAASSTFTPLLCCSHLPDGLGGGEGSVCRLHH